MMFRAEYTKQMADPTGKKALLERNTDQERLQEVDCTIPQDRDGSHKERVFKQKWAAHTRIYHLQPDAGVF